ncbi:hypothetical protein FACS189434_01910 [Bacteroidia bacterium]|nr:hypothetical protein FACS189434_01910 [Bacteroidia bacterium]
MKDLFKFIFSKKFLINLGIAVVALVAVCYLTLWWLGSYTSHGEEVTVIKIENMTVVDDTHLLSDNKNEEQAANQWLAENNLKVEVYDSIPLFNEKDAGKIIKQVPAPDAKIKKGEGRKIYVEIYSSKMKEVAFPNIIRSDRSAKMNLEAIGLKVSVKPVPSEHKDWVLYAKTTDGKIIATGTKLAVGTEVVLAIGSGKLSDDKVYLPSFREMSLEKVQAQAIALQIEITDLYGGKKPNEEEIKNYFVFKQDPVAGTEVPLGKNVKVWLTKDKSLLDAPEEVDDYIQNSLINEDF